MCRQYIITGTKAETGKNYEKEDADAAEYLMVPGDCRQSDSLFLFRRTDCH